MSTYEVGTVAVATVRGVEDIQVVRLVGSLWYSAVVVGGEGGHFHDNSQVTDIRPLKVVPEGHIVLDPEDERVEAFLANKWWAGTVHSIAVLIREQVAPPRIPEPDWGVIVRAADGDSRGRLRWQRKRTDASLWCSEAGHQRLWDELRDPTIVSHDGGES